MKKRILLGLLVLLLIVGGGGAYYFRERIFGPSVIRIGANMEMSGALRSYGVGGLNGLRLAVEEANATGGINGKKIVIFEGDARTLPAAAAQVAEKLITKDKVLAIVGPCTTGVTLGAVPVCERLKVPMISPSGSHPSITVSPGGRVNKYVYRACFIDPEQGSVMAQLATENLNAKTAAVMVDNTLDYSKGLVKIFQDRFEANGGKVVLTQMFNTGDSQYAAQLAAIKAANPDVVFIPANATEVTHIIRQARAMGITCPLLGTDTWDDTAIFNNAGPPAMQNVYFSTGYYDKDASVRSFSNNYKHKFGSVPNISSVMSYDAGKLVIEAIKSAKSFEPEKINAAIANTRGLRGITGQITFDSSHNPKGKPVVVLTYKGDHLELHTKISVR